MQLRAIGFNTRPLHRGIDFGEEMTLLHLVSRHHVNCLKLARHLGTDIDERERLEIANRRHNILDIAAGCLRDDRCTCLLPAPAGGKIPRAEENQEQNTSKNRAPADKPEQAVTCLGSRAFVTHAWAFVTQGCQNARSSI